MPRGRKPNVNKQHYVSNPELLNALVQLRACDFNDKKLNNYVGTMMIRIAKRILNSPNFVNYTSDRRDEMEDEAIFRMAEKLKLFNPDISKNPFAYFSEIALNVYRLNLKNQKNKDMQISVIDFLENLEDESDSQGDE